MMYVLGVIRIKRVRDTKILGVYIDESVTCSNHIEEITKRLQQELFLYGLEILQVEMYLSLFIML